MDNSSKKITDINFNLYDFFGYLIPGFFLGTLILLTYDANKAVISFIKEIKGSEVELLNNYTLNVLLRIMHDSPVFSLLMIIVFSYTLGHIISSISSLILERFFVEKILKYPTTNLFNENRYNCFLFSKYKRPYSKLFISRFNENFESIFKISPQKDESTVFWLCFEYIAHKCPSAYSRSIHFLNLYGYSRNLCMSFIIASIIIFSIGFCNCTLILWQFIIVYIGVSLILFWNYLKLLRRLNDEVFRSFYAISIISKNETSP
jgi:hypothetical protein